MDKLTLVVVAFALVLAGAAVASAQPPSAPPARMASAELVCLELLDADSTAPLARALVRDGAAIIEADRQTNCLVVIGVADVAPLRRVVAALEERVRTRRGRRP